MSDSADVFRPAYLEVTLSRDQLTNRLSEGGLGLRDVVRERPAARRVTTGGWDRDEWDVTLSDGATYRVYRERDTDAWFIEGVVD